MGITFLAEDASLQRRVALKIIKGDFAQGGSDARERFMREARAAAALRHPNVAIVYQFGLDDESGQYFCAMELVEGETLEERVRRTGPLDLTTVLTVARQVTAALAAAENRGLVHRDLKPGNIMITTEKGNKNVAVKVIDFGVAKALHEAPDARTLTHGGFVGTPAFSSPEQMQGTAVDVRSDIYSLGATLACLLTGRMPPLDRTTGLAALSQQLKSAGVPFTVSKLLSSMLAEEPAARPGVETLAKELESISSQPSAGQRFVPYFAIAAAVVSVVVGWFLIQVATHVFPFFGISNWAVRLVVLLLILGFPIALILLWASKSRPKGIKRETDGASVVADSKSLVVLPFANQSGDPAQEHFSDGLTEELINRLGRIRPLLVIGRNSSFALKGGTQDSRAIGQILGVANLLEGSVRKFNDRVRITVGLVRAADGTQLWTENYDRELKDVFAVQEEIATAVGERLRVTLLGPAGSAQPVRAVVDTEVAKAHHLYFCGRHHWGKRTEAGLQAAIKDFNAAIDIDPGNARSWAGLADCYTILGCWGYESPHKSYPKARAAAERALELDDTLSEAHVSLAVGKKDYYWDWAGAEQEYRRALELNPSNVMARMWYAEYLGCLGRRSEAIAEAERAQLLDPLALVVAVTLGRHGYSFARQYDRAVQELRETVRTDPDFWMAHLYLGFTYMYQERFGEALAEFALAQQLEQNGDMLAGTGYALGRSGRKAEARQVLAEIMKLRRGRYLQAVVVALVHIGLGEKDEAFFWLEEAFTERAQWLTEIKVDPAFDSLRADRRFEELLQRMGLA